MQIIPAMAAKRVKDAQLGELISAVIDDERLLGFISSYRDEEGESNLAHWFTPGSGAIRARYIDDDAMCVCYGSDWTLLPEHSSARTIREGGEGDLALHETSGWLFRGNGNLRSYWISPADGTRVDELSSSRALVFSAYKIVVPAEPLGSAIELHSSSA